MGSFPETHTIPAAAISRARPAVDYDFVKKKVTLLIHGLNALLPKLGSNGLFSRTKHLVQLNKISSGSKLESRQLKFR